MQQFGWILFGLIVLGPVAVGLLLDRMGLGRAISLIGMMSALGATVVLMRETIPVIGQGSAARALESSSVPAMRHSPAAQRLAADPVTAATARSDGADSNRQGELVSLRQQLAVAVANESKVAAALSRAGADLDAERAAHARTRDEIASLRTLAKSLETRSTAAEPSPDARAANALAVLESERAAHEKTRVALKAVEDQVAVLEASRARLAEDLASGEAERAAARKSADEAQRRLVLAEASIARLEAAVRGVSPRSEPSPLPNAPTPFSSLQPPAIAATSAIRPSATEPRRPEAPAAAAASAESPGAGGEVARRLAAGLSTRQLTLEKISPTELVQGQRGTYYRIACRDAASGKRLVFDGGAYTVAGGDAQLDACLKALQQAVLGTLPSGTAQKLYVQGFASPSGFIKPQRMPPGDTNLKTVDYLPLRRDSGQFGAPPVRQTVTATFANKELPVLRGAYVADRIANAIKGALKPEILEGDVKPAADEASRSFDLVLHVAW